MAALVGEPSRASCPSVDFALGGRDFQGDIGRARLVGDVPFNVFPRAISAARINLNITRRSHATVYASSSCRPFELAAAGAAIVSNPYEGIERWFEPGQELLVVNDADEARRGLPRPARRPGAGRGDGRARARARARRAHLPPPRAAAARAGRPRVRRMSTEVAARPSGSQPRCGGSRSCPAYNEERTIGRVLAEICAVRPGPRRRRRRRRLDRPHRRGRRGGRRARAPAAVQPRHRRRRADGFRYALGGRLRPRRARRRRRPARRHAARRRARAVLAARPTSSSARASSASGGYRSSAARRIGIRILAWVVSTIARQKRDRPDLRLPGAQPPRDRLFAADYPHDYPEVEAARDGRSATACASSRCR